MQIVIVIDESRFKDIQRIAEVQLESNYFQTAEQIIANGTPLPKGHGDLIDRNDLLKHYDNTTYHNGIEERKIHFVQIGYVNDAPTVIEADKESEI